MSFERLEQTAARLNAASDAVTARIVEIEERIRQTRIGIALWVRSDPGETPIGWAKLGEQWRVVFKAGEDVRPLVNASRAIRTAALARMTLITDALGDEAERLTAEIEAAVAKVAS